MAAPARHAPPGPLAAADRALGAARDLGERVRRWDRFRRMKVGIVAAWALASALTLWGACPASGPANSLGADVQVLRDSLVGGEQLLVRNESTEIWTDVTLTLDDRWKHEQRTVRPHDQLVLSMGHFRRGGDAAPRDYKPRSLRIDCGQGSHTFDLR